MTDEFNFQNREEKKRYVERMFGQIARRYDFFNHFLSLGFDYSWRRRAVEILRARFLKNSTPQPPPLSEEGERILDIACGTGDLSFEALRQMPSATLTGVD